jgi:hypothetical protein
MKLVIQTQHKENYGAHDWDGKGLCPQYWKNKGGNTYVVENLSARSMQRIADEGIPTLTALIENCNESWEEYIIDWEIVADDATVCEEWESPIVLGYAREAGEWVAVRVTDNTGEYGHMRKEILEKRESWSMLPNGEQANYQQQFTMVDGAIVKYAQLADWFDALEVA